MFYTHTKMWRRMQHTISHTDVGTGDIFIRMIPGDTVQTLTEFKKTKQKLFRKITYDKLFIPHSPNPK